jgi:hypothetical protein
VSSDDPDEDGDRPTVTPPGTDPASVGTSDGPDEGLGRAGWVLVVAVLVAVLVVPASIYLWPAGGSVLGANYRTAMLVLPMFPAVLLGLVAVWSMRDRRRRR